MRIAPFLAICLLAACARPEAEPPAVVQPSAATAAQPSEQPVDPNCAFCADPAYVRTCDVAKGVRTTLYWNNTSLADGKIGIYVVDDEGADIPFAEQPAKGSIETGPWLKPGLTFKLKDSSGTTLQTLVIRARDC